MRDALEYAGVRALEGAVSALPERTAARLGAALGRVAFEPLRVRRSVVEGQIAVAFPAGDRAWVRATARACYEHFGREVAELARLGRLGAERLRERTAGGEGAVARLRRELARGRGAVIVTGHIGNWELAGAFLAASGLRIAAVVKRQGNRRFDRRLAALRERLGVTPVHMSEVARAAPAILAAGTSLALVADQDARSRGAFVTFLGRAASTFRGPARLALAHGAPLCFGALLRDGEGYAAVLEPIPSPAPGGGAEEELTRRWVERLEREVRLRPEQYFWFHRRWKTRPPAAVGADGPPGAEEEVEA